jgi:cbb3-type cytochrome oxidase subunit 3
LLLRKSASVILLIILLFNMVGYRAWFYYAEKKADAAMEARLNKDQYDENDLVSLIVPLNNPYQLEQKSFQRVDGEISFEGKTLKYVKRKVSNGNLILLCIPDARKMILKKAKSDFCNASTDLTTNSKSSSRNNTQKNFSGNDYITDNYLTNNPTLPDFQTIRFNEVFQSKLAAPYLATPGKPPQSALA